MSERGIEIHNGEVVFPEGMPQELHLGTEASPITQGEAAQIVISAVINAIALGGTVEAGLFIAIGSVDLTGDLRGLRAEALVNDGITVTGSVYGARITAEVLGAGVITAWCDGIRLSTSSAAGSTIAYAHGIFLSSYHLGTISAANYWMLRMQENGTATVQGMLYLRANTVNYFALLHGNTGGWAAAAPNPSVALGWIKLKVGGFDRWIQLYGVAP